jgi:hypothetical protein
MNSTWRNTPPPEGPPRDWGYHITPMRNLPGIADSGLDPGRGGQFMQNYRWNTRRRIFFSGPGAMEHWHHIIERHAQHAEEPSRWTVPVVLRFPVAALTQEPEWDDAVKHDSFAAGDSWRTAETIPADYIDVWDGESWVPLPKAGEDLPGLYERVLDEALLAELQEDWEADPDRGAWFDPDDDEEDRVHVVETKPVDSSALHEPEDWGLDEPEWLRKRREGAVTWFEQGQPDQPDRED